MYLQRLTEAQSRAVATLNARLLGLSREHRVAMRQYRAQGIPVVHPRRMFAWRCTLHGFSL